MVDSPPLLKMDRYSTQQRILIVKNYFKNGESLTATIRKLRSIFGKQNVPSASTVKRIIEKLLMSDTCSSRSFSRKRHGCSPECGRESGNIHSASCSRIEHFKKHYAAYSQKIFASSCMIWISKTCGSNRTVPLATHHVKQWHIIVRDIPWSCNISLGRPEFGA